MHRATSLLATAALITAVAPVVIAEPPTHGLVKKLHGVRAGITEATSRFYGLADILTGINLHHKSPLPL